jgi:6,7-dimethyl-8-ribityllumazine synthase
MSLPSTIAERLLAHARLCREIARASWNEEIAQRLERLAQDCIRAAGNTESDPRALDGFDGVTTTPPAT